MLFIGATLMRIMSSAPIFTCSMVSFSEPSALLLKTLIESLPLVSFASTVPMYLTASTVG